VLSSTPVQAYLTVPLQADLQASALLLPTVMAHLRIVTALPKKTQFIPPRTFPLRSAHLPTLTALLPQILPSYLADPSLLLILLVLLYPRSPSLSKETNQRTFQLAPSLKASYPLQLNMALHLLTMVHLLLLHRLSMVPQVVHPLTMAHHQPPLQYNMAHQHLLHPHNMAHQDPTHPPNMALPALRLHNMALPALRLHNMALLVLRLHSMGLLVLRLHNMAHQVLHPLTTASNHPPRPVNTALQILRLPNMALQILCLPNMALQILCLPNMALQILCLPNMALLVFCMHSTALHPLCLHSMVLHLVHFPASVLRRLS